MSPDNRIHALVERWLAEAAAGRLLAVEELCQDCPDLLRQVEARIADLCRAHGPTVTGADSTADFRTAPESGSGDSQDGSPGSALPSGTAIAGFLIVGEIGQGGMGVVYHARDVRLNRDVALKMVLAADAVGPRQAIRFLAEAEAVAAIRHPNVVQVYEYGEHLGRPYLAMELCSRGTLSDRLRVGHLDPLRAAQLVEKLAGAVQAAHD